MHPSLHTTLSHSSSLSSTEVDITPHCVGTPHTIASSSSGSISLSLSLQQDCVFLACPAYSPSSYQEQDNGYPPGTADSDPYDPLNENFPDQSPSSILNAFGNATLGDGATHGQPRFSSMTPQQCLRNSSLSANSASSDLPPSILRGSLVMKLSKPTKIKNVSLRFYGKCKTGWLEADNDHRPEGSNLPSGPQFQDEVIVSSHTWEYVPTKKGEGSSIVTMNKESVVATDLYGADVAYVANGSTCTGTKAIPGEISFKTPIGGATDGASGPGQDHLKPCTSQLSHNNIPFFTPTYFSESIESTLDKHSFAAHSGATVYPQGEYIFHFNLAIDARSSETVVCSNGAIKYYLVAKIERPSRFSFAITGHKEVLLVRSPPNIGEVASNTPLSISRDWENKLHYEIQCPKKYIPLGSSIPLVIKLTPIEKVRVHRLRVIVVENVVYNCIKNNQLKHHEPARKVLLVQRCAGEPVNSNSDLEKKKKNKLAMMAGSLLHFTDEPLAQNSSIEPRKIPTTTCLDITLPFVTSDLNWDAQAKHHFTAPSADSRYFQFLRPDAIFNPFIHVKHRLHVSFRISRLDTSPDAERPNGEPKWRYFEVLIDTPIHFLSKECQDESVDLPSYSGSPIVREVLAENANGEQFRDNEHSEETLGGLHSSSNAIPIQTLNSSDIGMLSPLVQAISSPFSMSPPLESFNFMSLDDPLSAQLPSFDDALNDVLCGTSAKVPTNSRLEGDLRRAQESDQSSVQSVLSEGNDLTPAHSQGSSTDGSRSQPRIERIYAPLIDPPEYETIDRSSTQHTPPSHASPARYSLRQTLSHNSQGSDHSSYRSQSPRPTGWPRQLDGLYPTVRPKPRADRDSDEASLEMQEAMRQGELDQYSDLSGCGLRWLKRRGKWTRTYLWHDYMRN